MSSLFRQREKKLGLGSVYRSVRDLPATLKYDYGRRVINREAKKSTTPLFETKLLPDESSPSATEESLSAGTDIKVESIRSLIKEMEWLRKETLTMLMNYDSEIRNEKLLQVIFRPCHIFHQNLLG